MVVLERIVRGRFVVILIVCAGLAGGSFATWFRLTHGAPAAGAARPIPGERDHLVVEVINTTPAIGLARVASRRLRDAGIDVVYFGTEGGQALDSTQILVRRGAAESVTPVRRALGVGAVRLAPDSTRLVDVTVRLGRDFAAVGRNP
jgi:hypothetical protein